MNNKIVDKTNKGIVCTMFIFQYSLNVEISEEMLIKE